MPWGYACDVLNQVLRIAVLGPVRAATADGTPAPLSGTTVRALLAALALDGGAARSVEGLAAAVWPDDETPANPRGALQTAVSRARSAAGAEIVRSDVNGYALGEPAATDLAVAQAAEREAAGLAADDPARLAILDAALALWRGAPGADLGRSPVAVALAETADSLYDRLQRARAQTLLATGRAGEATDDLRRRAHAHPYDEELHVMLMTALADAGRTQEALAVFAELRTRLRDDLGASPGDAATELNTRILRGERMPQPSVVRIGLRAAPNELIGRDEDVANVDALLTRSRLVTILGAGGLGKTRLAQAVAAASASPLVAVVPLAGVRDEHDLEPAIGAALGISEARAGGRLTDARMQPDLRTRIVALLAERPALLVLDNCEQIIDGVAAWSAELLASVPTLRILTTSRTPVATAAESVYPLAPLQTADAGAPAVRLFTERALAVRPGAALDPVVVARLCERLDGLPLAIELAAARVRTMSAEQIESRLENRFALLRSADRAAPERHRTLEAVIEWSWDLLDQEARAALARLSLLPGGFSASTAAAVLGLEEVDDLLDRLVAQSLLMVVDDAAGIRFRMLETVREFGIARLRADGDEDGAWESVLAWARGWTRVPGAGLFDQDEPLRPGAIREVHAENENLVAALRYAIDTGRDVDTILVFDALTPSRLVRGAFSELATFAEPVAAALGRVPGGALPADMLAAALLPCALMSLLGEDPRALRVFGMLRRLARTRATELSPVWRAFVDLVIEVARPARMAAHLAEMRGSPHLAVRMVGEYLTSQGAENDGDVATAASSAQRAWRLAQERGDGWTAALAAASAAQVAGQTASPAEALLWLDRSQREFERFDATDELRQQDWIRGGSLLSLGRLEEAEAVFEQLTRVAESSPQGRESAAIGWFGLAECARVRGDHAEALRRYDVCMTMLRSPEQRRAPWFLFVQAGLVAGAALDGMLPPERIAVLARLLRTRERAAIRMRPQYVDRPVLGTVLAAWSAWAVTVDAERERGLEALALAETLGSRQDLPSVNLAALRTHAASHAGQDAVDRARCAALDLSPADRLSRALAVLGPGPAKRESRPAEGAEAHIS